MVLGSDVRPGEGGLLAAPLRWALVGLLLAVLLLLGFYDVVVHDWLSAVWLKGLAAVGLRQQVEAMQRGISSSVVKRLLPAVATYAVIYLGVCLLLLRLLLPSRAQWLLVLRLYAGALAAYVALVVLAKLAGDARWAYQLGRQLLNFVVSPLPVAGLYVLMRASAAPSARQ